MRRAAAVVVVVGQPVWRGRRPRAIDLDVLRRRRPDHDQILVLVLDLVASVPFLTVHPQIERLVVVVVAVVVGAVVRFEGGRRHSL